MQEKQAKFSIFNVKKHEIIRLKYNFNGAKHRFLHDYHHKNH